MSWSKRLKGVFAVRVRATVFTPSLTSGHVGCAGKPKTLEDAQVEAGHKVLLAAQCYAEQYEQMGSAFGFHFLEVPTYIAGTPGFKAALFTLATQYKLECVAVTLQSAVFKRIV